MKNIILIAPPAAGKGTLSNVLSKKYDVPHISTGELLRKRSMVDDEYGIDLLCLLKDGELVDDKIVLELLRERILQEDCKKGFILDGYPRNINQARELDNLLNSINVSVDCVIYLDVDKETAYKRVSGRMNCSNCDAIYNKNFSELKPKVDNICDVCGSKLEIRLDDNKESFDERFDVFTKYTYPVVEYYENMGKLFRVDAKLDVDEISNKVLNLLKVNYD